MVTVTPRAAGTPDAAATGLVRSGAADGTERDGPVGDVDRGLALDPQELGRPRPPYSVGPEIQPNPASNSFCFQALPSATSRCSCSGVFSSSIDTLSEPSPHTNLASLRFSAFVSRNSAAARVKSSIVVSVIGPPGDRAGS